MTWATVTPQSILTRYSTLSLYNVIVVVVKCMVIKLMNSSLLVNGFLGATRQG